MFMNPFSAPTKQRDLNDHSADPVSKGTCCYFCGEFREAVTRLKQGHPVCAGCRDNGPGSW